MTLADDIATIRRLADTDEALTPTERAEVQARINERWANRRFPNNLDMLIAQATADRDAAIIEYNTRVAVRDTPVTGTQAVHDTAQAALAALQDVLADKRIELENLQDDPPPVTDSDELNATRYVAQQEGVDVPYPYDSEAG